MEAESEPEEAPEPVHAGGTDSGADAGDAADAEERQAQEPEPEAEQDDQEQEQKQVRSDEDYDAMARFAREVSGPKQRRQMVMLAQTNDQLKKIVEYSHDLVGDVVGKLKDDLVRPYFVGWRDAMADTLRAGKLSRKAQRLNGRLKMCQVVTEWLRKIYLHRAQERKSSSMDVRGNVYDGYEKIMNQRLSASLGGWQAQVEKMKRRQRMIGKASKRLIGVRVAAAWSGWRDKHVHGKENRVKVTRMVAKLKHKQVAAGVAAWAAMTSELKRYRQIIKQCVAKMTKKSLLAGLEAFGQNAATQRRRKMLLQRCQAKMAHQTLSAAFLGARCTTLSP